MCPISGIVQFLIVIVTLLLICHTVVVRSFNCQFKPSNATIHMYDAITVNYTIIEDPGDVNEALKIYTENSNIADIDDSIVIEKPLENPTGAFNITGIFLGKTEIRCKSVNTNKRLPGQFSAIVIREERIIDTIFTASVATLVAIIYINFGCALNWKEMLANLKRPIGPIIGFIGQFLIMPLLSFGLGRVLFPGNYEMQLGMFFTGVSPAGGASNIWTVVLDGNMDLSVTMTTISTFAAFFMMPVWLFTLGKVIFDQGEIQVPYSQIAMYAVALVVPLAIGYFISRKFKKLGNFLVRILKAFSGLLLLFIVVFAIVANLYLFQLFSWQIVIAGMGLPYLGYILGYILAKILKQPAPDCLAIAIETGIQNTGIAIFLLRFTLPQPQADLTTIAPVSVAMMTPFPLLLMFIYKKIKERLSASRTKINEKREFEALNGGDNNNLDGQETRRISVISS